MFVFKCFLSVRPSLTLIACAHSQPFLSVSTAMNICLTVRPTKKGRGTFECCAEYVELRNEYCGISSTVEIRLLFLCEDELHIPAPWFFTTLHWQIKNSLDSFALEKRIFCFNQSFKQANYSLGQSAHFQAICDNTINNHFHEIICMSNRSPLECVVLC